MPMIKTIAVFLSFALVVAETSLQQQQSLDSDTLLQSQRIRSTLDATIANAKMEANRQLSTIKIDQENKQKLLSEVTRLQKSQKQVLDHQAELEQEIKTLHATMDSKQKAFVAAKALINKQKETISLVEEKERKTKSEYINAGIKIQQLIHEQIHEKKDKNNVASSSLLDEGIVSPNNLVSNVKKSLTQLKSQRIEEEMQGRQEAAALARRVQKEDTRSAEEKDQAAFEALLDHLDSSKPLMEQLGV